MQTKQMTVTPALATKWLEGNVHNRPLRQSTVDRYTRDMVAGRWRLTHQGIAFNEDGVLIDGQHRLWAVVESKTTQEMMVTRGLEMDAQEHIDGGEKRTTADVIALRGERASPLITGITVLLARHLTKVQNPSRSEQIICYEKHKEAITFAVDAFTRNVRGIKQTLVVTPVARAFYSQKREDLLRFSEVLCTGVSDGSKREGSIIILRNWLLEKNPERHLIYGKAERSLQAFLTNEHIRILYAAERELFLLPEEQPRRKKAS